ncbi:MAG: 30S ribosomal protein S4e [Candidatus Aenigmatarchaeota archaeon]
MRLKRYAMPIEWRLPVKPYTWVVRPKPGPHPAHACLPLQIILRDKFGIADTAKEAKKIIKEGKVKIDGKVRKEPAFPVGLMDVIDIEGFGIYRVLPGKRGYELEKIGKKDAETKICKIIGKKNVKGGLIQLNLHDGRNILVKDKKYKTGDSLLISIPEQKILDHYPFEKGQTAIIISGKNIGTKGKIESIKERKDLTQVSTVKIKSQNESIETLKEYVLVLGGEHGRKSDAGDKTGKGNN